MGRPIGSRCDGGTSGGSGRSSLRLSRCRCGTAGQPAGVQGSGLPSSNSPSCLGSWICLRGYVWKLEALSDRHAEGCHARRRIQFRNRRAARAAFPHDSMTKLHRNYSIRHELDNGNLYVVNHRGDTLGMLWWRPTGKFTVLLEHLEVYPPYQGRGIGTAMQAAFVELLPQAFSKGQIPDRPGHLARGRPPVDSRLG